MVELIQQNYQQNKILFNLSQQDLIKLLGQEVTIEHVGSTAIPDMIGKNIIDILVGAADQTEFVAFGQKLTDNNYYPSTKSKTDVYQFFASTQDETGDGDVHIHLVIKNTDRYDEFIILRDYLLNNPAEAQAYAQHKKQILSYQTTDRATYRQIKSKYVKDLISRAKQYKKDSL